MKRVFSFCLFMSFFIRILFSAYPVLAQEEATPTREQPTGKWIAVARGVVEPTSGIMRLAAQREGLIDKVLVEEGDHVKAGQELAKLNDKAPEVHLSIAQAELKQTRTQEELAKILAENAQTEHARLAMLGRADAIPRRQIDEAAHAARIAEIEWQVARQATELAQRRMKVQQVEVDSHVVRAPVDGVIVRRTARVGDGTSTSTVTELFLLAPDGPRVLKAQLDEQFVGLVHTGQKAEIIRERDDGTSLLGTVIRVAPVFGSLARSEPDQVPQGDDQRTLEISVRLDGPKEEIARLVLGQRLIARISASRLKLHDTKAAVHHLRSE